MGRWIFCKLKQLQILLIPPHIFPNKLQTRQLFGEFTSEINRFRKELIDIASLLEIELDFADEDLEFVPRTRIRNQINEIIKLLF